MQYSPKLKNAAEEIKAILKKYDIAGAIALHTPGNTEFVLELTPSYSCATVNQDHIRFKAKKEDYNDELKRHNIIKDTSNMMAGLSETVAKNAMMLIIASEQLDKITGAEHDDSNFTSHTTQNN
jgi:hypothetical protein